LYEAGGDGDSACFEEVATALILSSAGFARSLHRVVKVTCVMARCYRCERVICKHTIQLQLALINDAGQLRS
jgi:hypothetical protein